MKCPGIWQILHTYPGGGGRLGRICCFCCSSNIFCCRKRAISIAEVPPPTVTSVVRELLGRFIPPPTPSTPPTFAFADSRMAASASLSVMHSPGRGLHHIFVVMSCEHVASMWPTGWKARSHTAPSCANGMTCCASSFPTFQ